MNLIHVPRVVSVFENLFVFSKEINDSLQDSFKYQALPVYALMYISFKFFQKAGTLSSVAVWRLSRVTEIPLPQRKPTPGKRALTGYLVVDLFDLP